MKVAPIRTERLLLRRPCMSDADGFVKYFQDRQITHFIPLIPVPYKRKHAVAWLRLVSRGPQKRPEGLSYPLTIEMDGEMVGGIGMRWEADDKTANIGYWIAAPFRGQGLATEAARAVTSFAFSTLGAQKVWATADADNAASHRVLNHCAMRREGTLRNHTVWRGVRRDVCYYGVLRKEWERRRKSWE